MILSNLLYLFKFLMYSDFKILVKYINIFSTLLFVYLQKILKLMYIELLRCHIIQNLSPNIIEK